MSEDVITFATQLEDFLQGLGFKRTSIPKGLAFFHEPSGALIVLRHHQPGEGVGPTDLTIVRHHLDHSGLMDRKGKQCSTYRVRNCSLVG